MARNPGVSLVPARNPRRVTHVLRLFLPLLGFMVVAAASGCRHTPRRSSLVIRGGPLLRDVFPEVINQFRSDHPEVDVRADFTCPPCLLTERMSEGVEMDVFISAGDVERDELARLGLLDASTTVGIGSLRLVLAAPPENPANVRSLGDLHRRQVKRIAVGDPQRTSPGHYARQAFERMGLWSEVREKLVVTKTGCETLKSLALGEAEAGLLYGFCLRGEAGEPILVQEIPADLHDPIVLSLTSAPGPRDPIVSTFFEFMASAPAQTILRRAGINPPPSQ